MASTRTIQRLASIRWNTYSNNCVLLHHRLNHTKLSKCLTKNLRLLSPIPNTQLVCPSLCSAVSGSVPCMIQVREKGHSHWQNIQHSKGLADKMKASLIVREVAKLRGIAKEGGSNPKLNGRLAEQVSAMNKLNIPKGTIERALDQVKNKVETIQYYEVKGPANSTFVIQADISNIHNNEVHVLRMLKKLGVTVQNKGNGGKSIAWQHIFDKVGTITVSVTEEMDITLLDPYLEMAIEIGAEDVTIEDNTDPNNEVDKVLEFQCDPLHLSQVSRVLEQQYNLKPYSCEVNLIPNTMVVLDSQADIDTCQKIVNLAMNTDNIIKVFDNIEISQDS